MKKQILTSFYQALGVTVYVLLVAWLMNNAENIFGKMNNVLSASAFLILFVVSAGITGGLVLGKPLMMYFDNKKKPAIVQFGLTLGWLVIILAIVFVSIAVAR